ncbi:MAG TPA: hypothetical protein VKK79_01640 [Candidatus Lokiarchaeia archaeon]|nr:hypothetical protein [Candidatus Lokiarchaeia archaeon]
MSPCIALNIAYFLRLRGLRGEFGLVQWDKRVDFAAARHSFSVLQAFLERNEEL